MSTWCEIVRYRANMKAVFALTYDKSVLGPEKLFKRSENNQPQKHCCGILSSTFKLSSR
jgi:hypothetical protein